MTRSLRRAAWNFLTSLGILLLVISGSLLAGSQYAKYQTRQKQLLIIEEFERLRERFRQEDHTYTGARDNDYTAAEGETIAILRLDRLGIRVSVAEGTDREVLKLSAGHFIGTSMPGQGNFSIAGHSSDEYVCLFNELHEAVAGDEIIVTTRQRMHRYLVTDILTAAPEETDYISNTNESIITIVTCTDSGKTRLIIRGIEI
ncbi:class D sortase (plasmid) [Enterocloster clostridioformis]